jgi:drug/metabolite transporter (DMT)-like permease
MTGKAASTAVAGTTDVPALVAGLITVTAWGSAFVAIRAAGHTLSPGALALGRLLVSTAILGAVALARREPLPPRRDLVPIAVYGVAWLGVYSTALNAAERLVDAGIAAMIINIGPLLIALAAGLFLREGFPPGLFLGSAIAFTGCVVIAVATVQSGTRSALGIALCLVAVLAYAAAVVVQKPVLTRVPPFQVTWLGCAAATIACLPFAPALAADAARAGPAALGWIIYLGAVPTALGFATWAFALRRGSAGHAVALNYLIPVVAIVLGWAVLAERPSWLALAGGALCPAGVYLARRRTVRRDRRRLG